MWPPASADLLVHVWAAFLSFAHTRTETYASIFHLWPKLRKDSKAAKVTARRLAALFANHTKSSLIGLEEKTSSATHWQKHGRGNTSHGNKKTQPQQQGCYSHRWTHERREKCDILFCFEVFKAAIMCCRCFEAGPEHVVVCKDKGRDR